MQPVSNVGLVLEGGGLRGNFTAGVVRHFFDIRCQFTSVYGVSMGACNGVNIISQQPERNRILNTAYVHDPRYLSYKRLFKGGDLFGMDFIFRELPVELVPVDYETLMQNPTKFWVGVTDCKTGEAVMFEKNMLGNLENILTIMRASASLPLIAEPVEYNGTMYMDGGISNAVPYKQCLEFGEKPVIVLTQPAGYRKRASKSYRICEWKYPEFTGMNRILARRHEEYNDLMVTLEAMEKRGEVFIYRPESTFGIGRVSRNLRKLYQLYDSGYMQARARSEELQEFLAS